MNDDVLTRNENEELAVRVVSATEQSTVVNPDDVYTRDTDGNLAVRVVGSGGGDSHNKGTFATPEALEEAYPTAEAGDFALVGSTDTFWVWDEDTNAWVDTGNKDTTTYLPFPDGWHTTSSYTTKQFCDDIAADTAAIVGKAYLGEVALNDLPAGMANSELEVKIMAGTTSSNKVIVLTLTSGNISPYKWQYTYWDGGLSVSGWIGFQPQNLYTTTTLLANGWTTVDNKLVQTVTVNGVTGSNCIVSAPAPASDTDYRTADILCVSQTTNSLTFECRKTQPVNDITVNIIIMS